MPVSGTVSAYYPSGALDGSVYGQIWAGDNYGFSSPPPPPPPGQTYSLTVSSKTGTGQAIDGMWTVLYDSNGSPIANGYTPITFSGLKAGTTYSVSVADYGPYVFNHWEDGSTSSYRTFVANSNLSFVAFYD